MRISKFKISISKFTMLKVIHFNDLSLEERKRPILSFSFLSLDGGSSIARQFEGTGCIILESGEGSLHIEGQSLQVEEGMAYLVSPKLEITLKSSGSSLPFRCFLIQSDEGLRIKGESIIKLPLGLALKESVLSHLTLAKKHSFESPSEPFLCYLESYAAYWLLRRSYLSLGGGEQESEEKRCSVFVSSVREYLDGVYSESIEMGSIAKRFKVSRSTLDKRFKAEMGITPKEYLSGKRLLEAKRLLRDSDKSISEIASLCGFASAAHFIYFFRQECGFTPKRFKEKTPSSQSE